ncbi:hypothetical protein QWZ13_18945 [Reinekea marina]|uniref:hypothetical protein n=1 Tax=Reinekea marina TaxID=1310421 RepID=UPI0025B41E33|nr:hypothetical protein [Reinekea marina]MDN3650991.1 hypothetical protein [Reinekea marina]
MPNNSLKNTFMTTYSGGLAVICGDCTINNNYKDSVWNTITSLSEAAQLGACSRIDCRKTQTFQWPYWSLALLIPHQRFTFHLV